MNYIEIDETGKTVKIAGEDVPPGLVRVLTESNRALPSKHEEWALGAAYEFARKLMQSSEKTK